MAQATAPFTTGIPAPVVSRLRALRAKITTWLLIDGLSRVILTLVAVIAVDFLIDWLFSLDRTQRIVMLVIAAGVLGYVVYARLIAPLLTSVSDEALCLAVERHYGKELNESLISAVQFARGEVSGGVSPQLVRASIEQGTKAAERVPFGSVVDSQWFVANIGIIAACGVLLAAFGYAATAFRDVAEYKDTNYQLAEIWVDRDVLLKDRPWPQDTYLVVADAEDGVVTVPRGDEWTMVVTVKEDSKTKPDEVLVDFIMAGGGRHSEVMKAIKPEKTLDEEGQPVAAAQDDTDPLRFEIERSAELEPFQFRVRAAGLRGAKTRWFTVNLVDRPEVDKLELSTTAPKYAFEHVTLEPVKKVNAETQQEEVHLWEGPVEEILVKQGDTINAGAAIVKIKTEDEGVQSITSPQGGVVGELAVEKGQPVEVGDRLLTLTSVNYQLPPGTGPHQVMQGSDFRVMGEANKPLSKALLATGEGDARAEYEMDVSDKQFTFTLPADKLAGGGYTVTLWDQENVRIPGAAAAGPLKSKRRSGFTLRDIPDRAPDVVAKLKNISGIVTPDANIRYECFIKDEFAITDVKLKYEWRHDTDTSELNEGSQTISPAEARLGERSMKFDDAFDLAPLEIAPGSGLSFHIAAMDNNDISGPTEGKSTVFLLRVVTQGEFREELLRRQMEQGLDFQRLLKNQEELMTETMALEAASAGNESLSKEERQTLLTIQKNQKLIGTNIGNIAQRLNSIAQEMENNRLDETDAPLLKKLRENVIQPMDELARRDVPEVSDELDKSRRDADDAEKRDEALDKAADEQQQVVDKMKEVLKHIARTEGYQEAVNLLYEIEKNQKSLREKVELEKQKLEEGIFEGENP